MVHVMVHSHEAIMKSLVFRGGYLFQPPTDLYRDPLMDFLLLWIVLVKAHNRVGIRLLDIQVVLVKDHNHEVKITKSLVFRGDYLFRPPTDLYRDRLMDLLLLWIVPVKAHNRVGIRLLDIQVVLVKDHNHEVKITKSLVFRGDYLFRPPTDLYRDRLMDPLLSLKCGRDPFQKLRRWHLLYHTQSKSISLAPVSAYRGRRWHEYL
jgi:hypothetical protein